MYSLDLQVLCIVVINLEEVKLGALLPKDPGFLVNGVEVEGELGRG
jgi:hypothetical protein